MTIERSYYVLTNSQTSDQELLESIADRQVNLFNSREGAEEYRHRPNDPHTDVTDIVREIEVTFKIRGDVSKNE